MSPVPNTESADKPGRRPRPKPDDIVTLTARVKRRLRTEVKAAALEEGRTTEEWVILAVQARLRQRRNPKR